MTTPTLKPCPNPGCGGEVRAVEANAWHRWYVQCSGCCMDGPSGNRTREAAIEAWNSLPRTPEVDPLREAVERAVSDLWRMGTDWQERRYGLRSQGGCGLFLQTTHVEARLRDALKRHPIPMPPPPGEEK